MTHYMDRIYCTIRQKQNGYWDSIEVGGRILDGFETKREAVLFSAHRNRILRRNLSNAQHISRKSA